MALLSVADTKRLLAIVENETATFATAEAQFQELLQSAQRTAADLGGATACVATLRALIEHTFLAKLTVTSPSTVLVASFLLHGAASTKGSPVAGFAKAGFGVFLEELETRIRDDARSEEELRYKTSTAAGKKPLTGRDALETDGFRLHLVLKAAAFRMLLGTFDAQRRPRDLLSVDRAVADADVDSWPSQKIALTEAVSELRNLVEVEARTSSLGGLPSLSVPLTAPREPFLSLEDTTAPHRAVFLAPAAGRVPPPNIPAIDGKHGEFRPIIAPLATLVAFDGAPHQAEWRTAVEQLALARKKELTPAQSQSLITLLGSKALTRHLGLSIPAWLEVAEHNAQVAVAALHRVSSPGMYLDALLATPTGCRRSQVLLGAAKYFTPQHLQAYAAAYVPYIRSLAGSAATDAVSALAVTLHQLSDSGKSLPSGVVSLVAPLFTEHASAKDVGPLWGHLTKS